MRWDGADAVIRQAVRDGAFPGAVYAVGQGGRVLHEGAFGTLAGTTDPTPVTADTVYDLASLTKVVVTTTLLMRLHADGFDLDAPASAWVSELRGGGRDAVRVRHLLGHASGLPGWLPLYREAVSRDDLVGRVFQLELTYEPGTRAVYSDLGFIVLGAVLERATGEAFDTLAQTRVLGPLGMGETGYRPTPAQRPRIAPTEDDPWRGRVLRGEVHDENAHVMGGVAPHAGLFGTAGDLARFASMMAGGGTMDGRRVLPEDVVIRFTTRGDVPGSTWGLGWDTPSPEGYTSAGRRLSPRSFGHLGFTGTSLWIDPDRGAFVVLLSNRVYPTRDNDRIRAVRPALADAVAEGLDA